MGTQVTFNFPSSQIMLQVNILVGISLHIYMSILSREILRSRLAGSKGLHTSQCDTFCHTLVCKNNWNLMNSSEIVHQYTFLLKPRKRLLNFTPKMLLTDITSPLQLCLFGRRLILERLHLKDFYIFTEAWRGPGKNRSEPVSDLNSPTLAQWLLP